MSLDASLLLGEQPVVTSFKKEANYIAPTNERSRRTTVASSTTRAPLYATLSKRDSLEAYGRRSVQLTSMREDRFRRTDEWQSREKTVFVTVEGAHQKLAAQQALSNKYHLEWESTLARLRVCNVETPNPKNAQTLKTPTPFKCALLL